VSATLWAAAAAALKTYSFKITFQSDSSDSTVLSWPFSSPDTGEQLSVDTIPCLVYGLKVPSTTMTCSLYRSASFDPFILASFIDVTLLSSPTTTPDFIIEIPKILLPSNSGSSTEKQVKIRFAVVENTAGMIDNFIEVYFK